MFVDGKTDERRQKEDQKISNDGAWDFNTREFEKKNTSI